MASSADDNSRNLFSVCYKNNKSGHKFYINYVSDPSEKGSFKLPEVMLKLSRQPEGKEDLTEEGIEVMTNLDLQEPITCYLISRYGLEMPAIYLTEDAKDLVVDFHIFEGHAEALKRLPFKEPKDGFVNAKWRFLSSTMSGLILKIEFILGQKPIGIWTQFPSFEIKMLPNNMRMAAGERPNIERILQVVRMAPEDVETDDQIEDRDRKKLIPKWPIKVGDRLFSFGWSDEQMQRAAFYNILVSDDPNSLTLAPSMVKIARLSSREEAHAMARAMTIDDLLGIGHHIATLFFNYYREPQVYVAADNEKYLVFDVPFNLKHAPMLIKCFPGREIMNTFCSAIFNAYLLYFDIKRGLGVGMERTTNHHFIGPGEPITIARKATKKDIESVLFRKKGSQSLSDHLDDSIFEFMRENNFPLSRVEEMLKNLEINFP